MQFDESQSNDAVVVCSDEMIADQLALRLQTLVEVRVAFIVVWPLLIDVRTPHAVVTGFCFEVAPAFVLKLLLNFVEESRVESVGNSAGNQYDNSYLDPKDVEYVGFFLVRAIIFF